jgi:hypothetical protein
MRRTTSMRRDGLDYRLVWRELEMPRLPLPRQRGAKADFD